MSLILIRAVLTHTRLTELDAYLALAETGMWLVLILTLILFAWHRQLEKEAEE